MSDSARGNGNVIGVDIGGANLKYCDSAGNAWSTNFPLWQSPELLVERLATDLDQFTPVSDLAVTMTGELADCFLDRDRGVKWIVDHMLDAAARIGVGHVSFYGTDGEFHSGTDAKANPDVVAAANWHALASYAAKTYPSASTVIDVGSTTTDIIPVRHGAVSTVATTDYERLIEGSLVYVGCRRTPVCGLVDRLAYRGQECPVINEVFATIDDALLLLELTIADETDFDTADNQPRTAGFAANRIARMIGLDRRSVSVDDARNMAAEILAAAKAKIEIAFRKIHLSGSVVIAGHGQALLAIGPRTHVEKLSEKLGPVAARCAPSYAVAKLYQWQSIDVGIQCGE